MTKVGIWAFFKSARRWEAGGSSPVPLANHHSTLVAKGVKTITALPRGFGSMLQNVTAMLAANDRTAMPMPRRADSPMMIRPQANVTTMNQKMGTALAPSRAAQRAGVVPCRGARTRAAPRLAASESAGTSQRFSASSFSTCARFTNRMAMEATATAQ